MSADEKHLEIAAGIDLVLAGIKKVVEATDRTFDYDIALREPEKPTCEHEGCKFIAIKGTGRCVMHPKCRHCEANDNAGLHDPMSPCPVHDKPKGVYVVPGMRVDKPENTGRFLTVAPDGAYGVGGGITDKLFLYDDRGIWSWVDFCDGRYLHRGKTILGYEPKKPTNI